MKVADAPAVSVTVVWMSPIPLGAPHASDSFTTQVQTMLLKSAGTVSSTAAPMTSFAPLFVTVTVCAFAIVTLEISSVGCAVWVGVGD